jgi:hypothetical protein
VEDALREGYILTPFFAEQLLGSKKSRRQCVWLFRKW